MYQDDFGQGDDMRHRITLLAAVVLGAIAGIVAVSPAHATGPSVACRIQPYNTAFTAPCFTSYASYNYTVNFQVTGANPGATFTWTLTGAAGSTYGCGSTDAFCTKYVVAVQNDRTLTGSVTVN